MDQDPLFLATLQPDLNQLINETPPDFRLPYDLLKFLVERLGIPAPIDIGVCFREELAQERLEEDVEGFFPRTIVIAHAPFTSHM